MFVDDFKRTCNNKTVVCVIFGYTCPNVTEGVRYVHFFSQKGFPANHAEPILGSVHFFLTYILINHEGRRIKRRSKKLWPISCFDSFLWFVLFLLSLCQIPFGASTSTAAHKNPVKTPCCHYCNHSYQNSRPLAAEAAGRWAGTPSSVGCWSGGAWSQAG